MGDLVHIGPHRLFFGRWQDYRAAAPNERFDTAVFDPPYELKTKGGGQFKANRAKPVTRTDLGGEYTTMECHVDTIAAMGIADGFDLSMLSWELANSIFCFCSNNQVGKIQLRLQQGFRRTQICEWHKTNPTPVHNKSYLPDTEYYVHAWNAGGHPIGQVHDDYRTHITTPVYKNLHGHPTVKPADVMDKIMRNAQGDSVCDFFMGTGSTGVAAIGQGKIFTGCEVNQQAFDTAVLRVSEAYEAFQAKAVL